MLWVFLTVGFKERSLPVYDLEGYSNLVVNWLETIGPNEDKTFPKAKSLQMDFMQNN